ncbi:cation:proton antiporter [Allofrancisella guangzhouensis]|uniref:Sodium:proton exchanger n=1 Tax=Allofrancisella guangzhouensis TaxID=594679 RepID=A0A0A8E4R2_9GAMM|nr:cation:proton antiporter [Allofrancisella guangzhouensis]AJC48998.1 sodium:proton exchanger [Allofrancisella guangzhouensis]MBK2027903.1 cation:proton antiporter [Allofrancisella guangzhouensis]MBK2044156.1 cation:proton antiporter [Allofrancisella guangzhouensis]MBK2045136.1 cation:proton antiporter [Allofrancisella guangzhouensis]
MHTEPLISLFVFVVLGILVLTMVIKKLKQPYVVAYLLTGILLGPYGINLIEDNHNLARLGEIGVILLLFFAGMEISPRKFAENWKVPVIGTILQIIITTLVVSFVGVILKWPLAKIVLFGSVVSLSSTAVVLKLLHDSGSMRTRLGQNVLGVLLVQDLAVVPMLIIIGFLGGETPSYSQIILQVVGGTLVIIIAAIMAIKKSIKLSFIPELGKDDEMKVFAALIICFGMAALTGELGLSSALGAFVGGMIVATVEETEWVGNSLATVKTIFMALFFISIGMLINLKLVWDHLLVFATFLVLIFILNTTINTLIFIALRQRMEEALAGGAMLSQIGEFSFVLITMGYMLNILDNTMYQMSITLVSLSLLFSPLWISVVNICIRKFVKSTIK